MGKKRGLPPPKDSEEYGRFKDLLRRLVAVPRKEVDGKMNEHRARRQSSGKRSASS
jgi:hypothetical protein